MLALASRWIRDGADTLSPAAEAARSMGFTQTFASRPPRDAARAKGLLASLGVTVGGVAADPTDAPPAFAGAIDRAAEVAAVLRRPFVVADLGDAVAAAHETVERAVERWSRVLHAAVSAWSGLSIAIRPTGRKDGLFGLEQTAWLLDDLSSRPVGLFLDPVRAMDRELAGAGPTVLAWADRFAARTLGIAVHGRGPDGKGHARPEDDGPDWGTLFDLVPSQALRVLDVGPDVAAEEVIDARRHLEEVLHG
jgi:hypothetical protein